MAAKQLHGMLIKAVHQSVFVWTYIVSEGPGSLDHDFIGISAKESHGLFYELLKRHRFFSLAAIHQVRPNPRRSNFKHAYFATAKQKPLREDIGVQRCLSG